MPRNHSVSFSRVRHIFERCRDSGRFYPAPPADGRTVDAAKFAHFIANNNPARLVELGIVISEEENSLLRRFSRGLSGRDTCYFYKYCGGRVVGGVRTLNQHFFSGNNCVSCGACPICCALDRTGDYCTDCFPIFRNIGHAFCNECNINSLICTIHNKCCRHCRCLQCHGCGSFKENTGDFCSQCRHCYSCCSCVLCSVCERRTVASRLCSNCNRCRRGGCCTCVRCSYCDIVLPAEHCEDCRQCARHCRCEENRHIPSSIRQKSNTYTYSGEPLVGIEVEFNGCDDFYPIRKWARKWGAGVHSDGSCGWEAVTSPAAGPYLVDQIKDLCEAFDESSAQADRRCGIHVHVDARKLTAIHVLRLAKLYTHVEPVLYMIAGDYRVGNSYAAPNGHFLGRALHDSQKRGNKKREVYGLLSGIFNPRYSGDIKHLLVSKPDKKFDSRYYGLNLCPWVAGRIRKSKDTTIEFRLHRNSLNRRRITAWAVLCASLIKWCSKYEVDLLCKVDPVRSCAIVVPELSKWIMNRIRDWKKNTTRKNRNIVYKHGVWMFKNDKLNVKSGSSVSNHTQSNVHIEIPVPPVPVNWETQWTNALSSIGEITLRMTSIFNNNGG